MALTVEAMAASVGLAALGGAAAFTYVRPAVRFAPRPVMAQTAVIARLYLHRVDLLSYLLAACGVLGLIPEALQTFAPELMSGASLAGSGLEHLDYVAFVLVSISFGMGLARRVLLIGLEKASLTSCP